MKNAKLIADSGGTKTDWVLIDDQKQCTYFTTPSYHPSLINDNWLDEQLNFWKMYTKDYLLEVHFFGAGCLKPENQQHMISAFEYWGIKNVRVKSDILAAFLSTSNEPSGYCAILGTGSVIGRIDNLEVNEIFGGLGYTLGDEGSGFYFGKLVIQKLIAGHFSKKTEERICELLDTDVASLNKQHTTFDRGFVASLSFLLKDLENDELSELHRANATEFIHRYLPKIEKNKLISFVGSYGFSQKEVFQELFENQGWKVQNFCEKPIRNLAEYFIRSTF